MSSRFTFIANSKSFEFEINGTNEEELLVNKYLIISPFVSEINQDANSLMFDYYQQNTSDLRKRVRVIVDSLSKFNPRINKLADYFEKDLLDNEWFFFAVDTELLQSQVDSIMTELLSIDADEEQIKLNEDTNNIIQQLRALYDISSFGVYTKKSIGEPDKKKRVCRYCHRSMPDVTFKDVAHTISEALGNKCIKTNDECDECNHMFGETIEQDFLSIFDIQRLFFRIKNKRGYPHKFVGDNYTIEKEPSGKIKLDYHLKEGESLPDLKEFQEKLLLTPHRDFPVQHIYKALCKYIFGVLDEETLKSFERTRRWLMNERIEEKLPLLARLYHPEVVEHPSILLYVRKDDTKKELPHVVAEIRIINLAFIVILPFSDKDTYTFNDKQEHKIFWDFFEIYSKVPGWQIADCSSLESHRPTVALSIMQNSKKE